MSASDLGLEGQRVAMSSGLLGDWVLVTLDPCCGNVIQLGRSGDYMDFVVV